MRWHSLTRAAARIAAGCILWASLLPLATGRPDEPGAQSSERDRAWGKGQPESSPPSEPACVPEVEWEREARAPSTRIIDFDERRVAEVCESYANANVRAIERVDSLYRAGFFGRPGEKQALRAAHHAYKLLARCSLDYVADLATRPTSLASTNTVALRRPFGEVYLHCGAYPFQLLRSGVAGLGRFRMEYDLVDGFRENTEFLIGRPAEVCVEKIAADGRETPVIRMPFGTSGQGTVDLLIGPVYRGCVSRRVIVDRGDTLDLILIAAIDGGYVRKYGVHRMAGIAMWRGRFDPAHWNPERVRVGAAAYFPEFHIDLPWLLPKIGADDVREFHVPHPILSRLYVRRGARPAWLQLSPSGTIEDWEPEGPRPMQIDELFPDRP